MIGDGVVVTFSVPPESNLYTVEHACSSLLFSMYFIKLDAIGVARKWSTCKGKCGAEYVVKFRV